MKKRLIVGLTLLVLFSTYKPQNLFLIDKFKIKEIEVENNNIVQKENIIKKLSFLSDVNLIFLDKNEIEKKLKRIDFIDSFEIKKIYPNKIKIRVYEKKPIAILQNKKEKFYLSDKIELINYIYLKSYKDLPFVFGNKENFEILYQDLKKINFPLELIAAYYFFDAKRWDLETHNKTIIKLPSKNYTKSLNDFVDLRKEDNFDKYKIFDYRINDQLILK